MFKLIQQMITASSFSRSFANIVNTPAPARCVSLNYQQYMTQPTLINLHPNEYIEGRITLQLQLIQIVTWEVLILLMIYPIKECVPNKTEDLNFSVFNMKREKNESKMLAKHKSCECIDKFDGRKC